jgi:hypothetical protein
MSMQESVEVPWISRFDPAELGVAPLSVLDRLGECLGACEESVPGLTGRSIRRS